jgi:hypothetical protein
LALSKRLPYPHKFSGTLKQQYAYHKRLRRRSQGITNKVVENLK